MDFSSAYMFLCMNVLQRPVMKSPSCQMTSSLTLRWWMRVGGKEHVMGARACFPPPLCRWCSWPFPKQGLCSEYQINILFLFLQYVWIVWREHTDYLPYAGLYSIIQTIVFKVLYTATQRSSFDDLLIHYLIRI